MSDAAAGPARDERDLVERARQGDRGAFGAIYQRYVDRVYSFIEFRVRDGALAEDLTQEVFVQSLRGLESFEWQGALAPWLLRIARNAVVDHWRRTGRRPERPMSQVELDDEERPDREERLASPEAADALEAVDRALDRDRILQATVHLTELQQQVVALRFAAGLSLKETAAVMGRSEGAVKNLQHHALRALRRALATEGGEA